MHQNALICIRMRMLKNNTYPLLCDNPSGRLNGRPSGFGRGKGLQTPQPRLHHLALAGAPPTAAIGATLPSPQRLRIAFLLRLRRLGTLSPPPACLLLARPSITPNAPRWRPSKTRIARRTLQIIPRDAAHPPARVLRNTPRQVSP